MPSTYTDGLLDLEKQANGENENTWGNKLNTALDVVDRAITGFNQKSVAGGSNVTLTQTESEYAFIELTGALTANIEVYPVSAEEKLTWVKNNTSGAYTLTFKPSGGSGVQIPQGETALVYSDGTNIAQITKASDLSAPGAIGDTTPGSGAFSTLSASGLITASAGITFGDETLDEYDEGTWTPQLEDAAGPGTHAVQFGAYTRIGRLVHIQCRIRITAFGSIGSGQLRISGLPFTPATVDGGFSLIVNPDDDWNINTSMNSGSFAYTNSGYIYFYHMDTTGPDNLVGTTKTQIGSGAAVQVGGWYHI